MKFSIEQAIASFESGNPSTKAFTALGLPFEAFLRWGQIGPAHRAALLESLRSSNWLGRGPQ